MLAKIKIAKKGGLSRAKSLSRERRIEIATKAAEARWGSPKPSFDAMTIADFCRRHRVTKFALFGSVLTDKFGPKSDIDVLVDLEDHVSLFDLVDMKEELEKKWKRKVDVLVRRGVERDHYERRKRSILDSATVIYAR